VGISPLLWHSQGILVAKIELTKIHAEPVTCVKKFDSLQYADLHFSFPVFSKMPDPTSSKFVSEWREFMSKGNYFDFEQWLVLLGAESKQLRMYKLEASEIIHRLSLKSYEGRYKIQMIWMPELLGHEVANKLLKNH